MSYPVIDVVQLAPITAATGSYPVSLAKLSPYWANDDWVFVAISCSSSTGTLAHDGTTGWSEVTELDISSGARMAVYKAKITGGTIGAPTINLSSGTGLWVAFAWIERDADTTDPTPTNHYGSVDSGSVTSFSSATLTPGAGSPVDNCRIVYFAVTKTDNGFMRMLDSSVIGDSLMTITDGSVNMYAMVASTAQTTAAATAKTIYSAAAARTGCITLAIKPGAGGKRARQATLGITRLAWLGNFGATHDGTLTPATSSWGAPTSRTISGVAVSTTAATRVTNITAFNEWGSYDNHSCALGTANWQGGMLTFTADVDMSGKLFAMEWNSPSWLSQVGDKGLIVVFEDNGGTNWEAFQLSQKAGWIQSKEYGNIIDLENATPYDSGGTLDWTLVRKVSLLLHRSGSSAAARNFSVKNMLLLGTTTLVGGNSSRPLNINYLRNALHGMGYLNLTGGESPALTIRSDVQIGDGGTTATYYDATGTLHAFPDAYDALTQREINIPANKLDLTIDAGPDDTINLTATAISATVEQNFTFASGTDAGANYSLQGAAIIGVLATGQTAVPQVGATYSGCDEVAFGGADISSVTITDTTSTDAACSFDADGAVVTSCTIDGTGALYAIELGTAVTAITLASCTITAGSTDKIHVLKTTGTVTITISGTTSLAAGDVTSAGATVVISAPVLYQSVVVSGFTAGSRIQIYDTTNSVELFNGTASAGDTVVSGTTATWTDPTAAAGSRAIRVRVAYVSGVTAKQFIETSGLTCGITDGTESVTYPVTPTADAVYNANGLNGSTIYAGGEITFTDAAQDLINMDMSANTISLGTQYAAWVYYAFTSAGIATDIDYINAIDTANYEFTGIKWKNTSSPTAPLKITGGYAWDSVTLDPMDLIDDTGGTIFLTPPHVVAYATGSGPLTPSQESQLAAAAAAPSASTIASTVLTSAQSAPIYADVRKVTGVTVTGVGTEADPWGPP